jgi:glycosyltransferase involved in cell wall biosynthesis
MWKVGMGLPKYDSGYTKGVKDRVARGASGRNAGKADSELAEPQGQSSPEEHLTRTMITTETSQLYSTPGAPIQSGQPMARRKNNPSALTDPKVSVVIPVFNEKDTIDEILRRVLETQARKEVIIVDDSSSDGTRQKLKAMEGLRAKGEETAPASDGGDPIPLRDLRFFFQTQNQGKGAALRRGFAQVTGDIVLVQDADLEYDPRDYPKLLEPIIDGRADVVYGSRFLGGPQRVHYFWHYVANSALTLLSDIATNLKLTDMETCYKVFRREVLQGVELKSDRFGFEPEITAKIAKKEWRIYEVPISYAGRTYEEGKKITWKDGVQALWCIIKYKFTD